MKFQISKEELMKSLEDIDKNGNRWIKGHYLWPDFIVVEGEPIGNQGNVTIVDMEPQRGKTLPPLPEEIKREDLIYSGAGNISTLMLTINEVIRYLRALRERE